MEKGILQLLRFKSESLEGTSRHRRNEEGDQGGPWAPQYGAKFGNKEQNGVKKFQNGAFLGNGNS